MTASTAAIESKLKNEYLTFTQIMKETFDWSDKKIDQFTSSLKATILFLEEELPEYQKTLSQQDVEKQTTSINFLKSIFKEPTMPINMAQLNEAFQTLLFRDKPTRLLKPIIELITGTKVADAVERFDMEDIPFSKITDKLDQQSMSLKQQEELNVEQKLTAEALSELEKQKTKIYKQIKANTFLKKVQVLLKENFEPAVMPSDIPSTTFKIGAIPGAAVLGAKPRILRANTFFATLHLDCVFLPSGQRPLFDWEKKSLQENGLNASELFTEQDMMCALADKNIDLKLSKENIMAIDAPLKSKKGEKTFKLIMKEGKPFVNAKGEALDEEGNVATRPDTTDTFVYAALKIQEMVDAERIKPNQKISIICISEPPNLRTQWQQAYLGFEQAVAKGLLSAQILNNITIDFVGPELEPTSIKDMVLYMSALAGAVYYFKQRFELRLQTELRKSQKTEAVSDAYSRTVIFSGKADETPKTPKVLVDVTLEQTSGAVFKA